MIIPDQVAAAAAILLNNNKETIGIEMAGEIGEETPSGFVPPYAAMYIDTVEESTAPLTSGNIISVPFDLNILITSGPFQTTQEASTQSWGIAFKSVGVLLTNLIKIDNVPVPLKLRPLPFQILKKTAAECVIQIRFRFYLNKWD